MVGTATLTGRFSVAVVTASPESKVNICEVFIVLYSATDVVSAPAVIFDNELPLITAGQRKFPKTPVIRRIASPCAEPAARFPPVKLGNAEAITKTQARRPRYRMTGIATLTGRLSAAVGTTLAAEKTRLPYSGSPPDASIMPLFGSRTTDIAPDDGEPGVEPILHRFAVPAISRIASPCQLPASLPVPPSKLGKAGGRSKKT